MLTIGKSDWYTYSHLKGFGGWLIFFTVTTAIGNIRDLFAITTVDTLQEKGAIVLWIFASLYGLYLAITLNRYAPTYWTITLLIFAALSALTGYWAFIPRYLVWLLYWERSKRVLVTYGSTGLGGKFGIGSTLLPEPDIPEAERTPT